MCLYTCVFFDERGKCKLACFEKGVSARIWKHGKPWALEIWEVKNMFFAPLITYPLWGRKISAMRHVPLLQVICMWLVKEWCQNHKEVSWLISNFPKPLLCTRYANTSAVGQLWRTPGPCPTPFTHVLPLGPHALLEVMLAASPILAHFAFSPLFSNLKLSLSPLSLSSF